MAKLTLLELTQDILNDMDSDSVNSIDDTVESIQVAQIIKTTYSKLATARDDWPFFKALTVFTGLGDTANPTKMGIPDGLNKIYWVKYNKKDVLYVPPKEFKDIIDVRTELATVVSSAGYVLNSDPQYYTSYDEEFVFFDAIDLATDTTLQQSKVAVYGIVVPTWTHTDSFVPILPEKMFPTLLADAKGTAFLALKQQANAKEEAYAKTGLHRFQNAAYKVNKAEPTTNDQINYGRK